MLIPQVIIYTKTSVFLKSKRTAINFKNSLGMHWCKDRAYVSVKPIFHLATLFARREAKTRIRQRD